MEEAGTPPNDRGEAIRAELSARLYPHVRDLAHRDIERFLRRRGHPVLAMLSTGDIVHETYLEVYRDADHIHANNEAQLIRYLSTVVTHQVLDKVRRYQTQRRDLRRQTQIDAGTPAETRGPAARASTNERVRIYGEVLAAMSPRDRTLLELRLEHHEDHATIAHLLGYGSAATARQAFRSARTRLVSGLRARGVRAPGDDDER